MQEIRRSGTWGSALTSDEFTAIRGVGFEPVGQVLGAAVYNIGYTGGYGCAGAWTGYYAGARSFGPAGAWSRPPAAAASPRSPRWCRPCTTRGTPRSTG